MTGRGRARKASSPNTKCAKSKVRPEEAKQRPGKDSTEERQNGTAKEQKPKQQKKTKHTEEKPSVQSTQKEKTTEQFTEEITKQQRTPTDNKKALAQGAKAKTCAVRAKTGEQLAVEKPKTQLEKPQDITRDSVKTTKAKTPGGRAKSPVEFVEEIKKQPETPEDITKDSLKTTKAKTPGRKAKSPVEFVEETKKQPETPKHTTKTTTKTTKAKICVGKATSPETLTDETVKMQPETLKDTREACVPQDRSAGKAAVDCILKTTLEKLKIKRNARSDAAKVINEIIENITTHLKKNTQSFKEVKDPLHTGSYYENLKISNPDEFDVMMPIPVDRVSVEPFGEDGAFYSVALKRGKSPLQKFQETDTLSASKMLEEFRTEVKKSVKTFTEWEVTKKKKGCPAVTLITTVNSIEISLDVVLCLVVNSSWPAFTKDGLKVEGWLGTKVRLDYRRQAYYLVPKYEGKGTVENDAGVLAKDIWRVSFSHIEKAILKNHGSEKTCCEEGGARCCRKDCLKLLKHLLSLLKESDSSFDKFCSYHAKTTLLHACCSRTKDSEWRAQDLSHCFQLLLGDFIAHLKAGKLYNFFIPTQNLLSGPGQKRCDSLARCIKEECDKGFPIFK